MWLLVLGATLLVWLCGPARAAAPLAYSVNARAFPDAGYVEGAMWVQVELQPEEREIRLWLYPDRLAVAPGAMNEINARWIYPAERDFGGIEVHDVRVDGESAASRRVTYPAEGPRARPVAGSDLLVSVPPDAGRRVELRLRFRLRVPQRFGRLGRVDDQLSLMAPWYPIVVEAHDGYASRVPQRLQLEVMGKHAWFAAGELRRGRASVGMEHSYIPVVIADELHVTHVRTEATEVRFITPDEPYQKPPDDASGIFALHDVVRVDVPAKLEDAAAHVAHPLLLRGLPVPPVLDVVEVPSRTELASIAPDAVLLSDRAYEILPLDVTQAFHDRALRRAMYRRMTADAFRGVETVADRPWAADLRAALLNDLDQESHHRTRHTPADLLGFASFHPVVDQLLYAPQVPFEDVYFGAISEHEPFRDDPMRARLDVARGRRLLEAARDALDEPQLEAFRRKALQPGVSIRRALGQVAPEVAPRLDAWLAAPREPANYTLGEVHSEPVGDGRFRHVVHVQREGARRVEPVTVRIEDEVGETIEGVWERSGERGEVVLYSEAPLDEVQLDPRHRLSQSAELTEGHPRADDTTSLPWRPPLVTFWDIAYQPSQGQISTVAEFALRRRYDLNQAFVGGINADPRTAGGFAGYRRNFGPKLDTNRRPMWASAGLGLKRLHAGFGGGTGQGGYRAALRLGVGLTNLQFPVDPRRGEYASARLRIGSVFRDDGSVGATFRGSVRAGMLFPTGLRNTTLLLVGGSYTGGQVLDAERPDLAGDVPMRAFGLGELLADGIAYMMVEHRWTAFSNLAWNALHYGWVRELQLAAFAASGAMIDPVASLQRMRAHAEVGGGLRIHMDVAGVQRALVRLDVARALTRTPAEAAEAPPVNFTFSFAQVF